MIRRETINNQQCLLKLKTDGQFFLNVIKYSDGECYPLKFYAV